MAEHTESPYSDVPAQHPGEVRWNLLGLYCYSHDGRRRDVELALAAVNIITGHSRTGKSALADLIDYVMGSSECNLPGRVFEASAWVGLLWSNGQTQCFIARRVPDRRPRGTDDFFYRVGAPVIVPERAVELVRDLGRDLMLYRFESLLGIGDVKTEVFGAERAPVRVSFRNAIPYLLQDASHINNRTALLRGMEGQQRQHLLDTLPYFLGVVDEGMVARQARLRQLRAEIAATERRNAERRTVAGEPGTMARALLAEAVDVGLAEAGTPNAGAEEVFEALIGVANRVAEWPELFTSDATLASLYDRQQALSERGSALRRRIEATRRAMSDALDFRDTSDAQHQRLQVVELLPDAEDGTCPLCVQPLGERVEGPSAVRRAVNRVRVELAGVARERPKLDGELAALDTERAAVARELQEVRTEIAEAVHAADDRERLNRLDRQRLHVTGRISLYLQTATPPTAPVDVPDDITALRGEAEALAAELDPETKKDAMDVARTRLSALATEIAAKLPFDPAYVGQPIDVNLRTLAVSVVTAREREDMRAIGSDENCQTLHLAVLLALHRVFHERRRPVPGFLLLDQLSRPYYPPTGEQEVEVGRDQPEVASLRGYFDALFAEVARGEGLQLLVLEHAYFSDDDRFRAATRERWIEGEKLIPSDWPERD